MNIYSSTNILNVYSSNIQFSTKHRSKTAGAKIRYGDEMRSRENNFVLDSVKTNTQVFCVKYASMQPYDARTDPFCKNYFNRKNVQKLLKTTIVPRRAILRDEYQLDDIVSALH